MIKNIYYILYEKKDKIDKGVFYSMNVTQIKNCDSYTSFFFGNDSTRDSLDLLPKNQNKNRNAKTLSYAHSIHVRT